MKAMSRFVWIVVTLCAFAGYSMGQGANLANVEIKATKITNNFYTLEGSGGTVGVLVGPDGVLMVDAQYAQLSEKIVAAIKGISNGNIRFLINTHVHGDHTGGNENFGKMGVTIVAREELRNRLAKPNPNANGTPGTPAPAAALPALTYTGKSIIHMDGEDVELIAIPKAHTDGDTLVRFPKQDVLMTGDYFRSLGYPNIDRANGGSLQGMLDGLNVAINLCGAATKVIPGHGAIADKAGLTAHRDMIIAIRDKVSALVRQGKTLEEVVAAKPTADYDSKVPGVGTTGERFIGQLYAELKGSM
jgi:glyoxylase-like metal-dependent hydrolase (beta-lactamase superfamily II)